MTDKAVTDDSEYDSHADSHADAQRRETVIREDLREQRNAAAAASAEDQNDGRDHISAQDNLDERADIATRYIVNRIVTVMNRCLGILEGISENKRRRID